MGLLYPAIHYGLQRVERCAAVIDFVQPPPPGLERQANGRKKISGYGGGKRDDRRNEHIVRGTREFRRSDSGIEGNALEIIQGIDEFLAHRFPAGSNPAIEGILNLVFDICSGVLKRGGD